MRAMTLNDLELRIERRKALVGLDGDSYVMANSGEARTPQKRALLCMLAATAAERGVSLPFQANA
jgi:hypothetical protein